MCAIDIQSTNGGGGKDYKAMRRKAELALRKQQKQQRKLLDEALDTAMGLVIDLKDDQ
jgi:hypothetical protein